MAADSLDASLPASLVARSRQLGHLGVAGVCWTREDALGVIEIAENGGFVVLGGDVLDTKGGRIAFNYCNWYVTRKAASEEWGAFVQRAADVARAYLCRFDERGIETFYCVVIADKRRYESLGQGGD